MTDSCGYRVKNVRNSKRIFSVDGIILLTFVAVVGRCDGGELSWMNEVAAACAMQTSCTGCVTRPPCSWSLERQACEQTTNVLNTLTVNIAHNCPRYEVLAGEVDGNGSNTSYSYRLRVTNDKQGLLTYLSEVMVLCLVNGLPRVGRVSGDTVVCQPVAKSDLDAGGEKHVLFNAIGYQGPDGRALVRMGNATAEMYTADVFCGAATANHEHCVTCSWWDDHDGGQIVSYYRRCTARAACSGEYEFFEQRAGKEYTQQPNATAELRCDAVRVLAVEPRTADWDTDNATEVRVSVRNHGVMAEGRPVAVTVAGRVCADPRTVDGRTVACTVRRLSPSAVPGDGAARLSLKGPVVVRYGDAATVTSEQPFRFEYPEVFRVTPTCGSKAGGTLLRVAGRRLRTAAKVRVFVGTAECAVTGKWDPATAPGEDVLFCVTGPAPSDGSVRVTLRAWPGRGHGADGDADADAVLARSAVTFAYTDQRPAVDADQRRRVCRAVRSGAAEVTVRGTWLSCVDDAMMYVEHDNGSRWYDGCRVVDDTRMTCRAPGPADRRRRAIRPDGFGFRLSYAGNVVDLLPESGPPGSQSSWFADVPVVKLMAAFGPLAAAVFLALYYVRFASCRHKWSSSTSEAEAETVAEAATTADSSLIVEFEQPDETRHEHL